MSMRKLRAAVLAAATVTGALMGAALALTVTGLPVGIYADSTARTYSVTVGGFGLEGEGATVQVWSCRNGWHWHCPADGPQGDEIGVGDDLRLGA